MERKYEKPYVELIEFEKEDIMQLENNANSMQGTFTELNHTLFTEE